VNLLAGIWTAAVVAISLQPFRPPHDSGLSRMHRPVHFLLFGVTALILWRVVASIGRPRRPWLCAILCTVALGLAIELLQHLTYRNPMEWWDVRDDALSAAAAVFLILLARSAVGRFRLHRSQASPAPTISCG